MKTLIIITAALLLSGCNTTPIQIDEPDFRFKTGVEAQADADKRYKENQAEWAAAVALVAENDAKEAKLDAEAHEAYRLAVAQYKQDRARHLRQKQQAILARDECNADAEEAYHQRIANITGYWYRTVPRARKTVLVNKCNAAHPIDWRKLDQIYPYPPIPQRLK